MAEEAENQVPEALDRAEALAETGASGSKLWLIVSAVAAALGTGVGFGTGRLLQGTPTTQTRPAPVSEAPKAPSSGHDELAHYDLDEITTNLNEPRLARHVRAEITLAFHPDDEKAAKAAIEKKLPELKSWLNVYFSGCTLEEIRGPKNLNRISQEIRDELNKRLWPDSRSLIQEVLFRRIIVQ